MSTERQKEYTRSYRIALAQFTPKQGDTAWNLDKILKMIEKAAGAGASLLVLPELSYTGYRINHHTAVKLAESPDGFFVETMRRKARENRLFIFAGYSEISHFPNPDRDHPDPEYPDRECFNAAVLIDDTGAIAGSARKVFRWKKEKQIFVGGDHFTVCDTSLGRIGLSICYDLEFSEPSRILGLQGAELILNAAAWSKAAANRWEIDLRAAALYNLLFTAGANYADDNCCGQSMVAGPDGIVRSKASGTEEELLLCDICLDEIKKVRGEIPYWEDFRPDLFSMNAVKQEGQAGP